MSKNTMLFITRYAFLPLVLVIKLVSPLFATLFTALLGGRQEEDEGEDD
jgi:hypothetical protein